VRIYRKYIEAIPTNAGWILPSTDKQGACSADKGDGCASAIALTNGLFIIG